MFTEFFYLLKARGLNISTKEWMTLMEGLELELHDSTLMGFYRLCMAVLCKSEADYDLFQTAFYEFFHDKVLYDGEGELRDNISETIMDYVNNPGRKGPRLIRYTEEDITEDMKNWDRAEIERKFRHRLENQKKEHNGGKIYVGTHGISPYGNAGFNPNAIRVGGQSNSRQALRVAGERKYRDFREDNTLSIRQYQMAFRRLRCLSSQNNLPEEFDVDRTVHDTCDKGGVLQVRYKKPRRNNIKVLMLMDSGGSMAPYSQMCSRIFQAASKSNRFKDLKVYYFHNCVDTFLYTNPSLETKYEVYTDDILRQCDKDYRVILVGDATMEMSELTYAPPQATCHNKGYCGQDWLKYVIQRYPHAVWLTPTVLNEDQLFGHWGESYAVISSLFPMYHLSVSGLEQAMKKLMVLH